MQKEYLIVLPIEAMSRDNSYPHGQLLPMHCTVMHWFNVSSKHTRQKLVSEARLVASSRERGIIELVSDKPDLFGSCNNVPVHTLVQSRSLSLFHSQLYIMLAKMDSLPIEQKWIGAGYRPHVTTCLGREFLPGMKHAAKQVILIERGDNKTKVVRDIFQLGKTS